MYLLTYLLTYLLAEKKGPYITATPVNGEIKTTGDK